MQLFSQLLSQPPIQLNQARQGMRFSSAVESVIMRGLAKEPPRRYPSAVDFGAALVEAVAQPADEKNGMMGKIKRMFGRDS